MILSFCIRFFLGSNVLFNVTSLVWKMQKVAAGASWLLSWMPGLLHQSPASGDKSSRASSRGTAILSITSDGSLSPTASISNLTLNESYRELLGQLLSDTSNKVVIVGFVRKQDPWSKFGGATSDIYMGTQTANEGTQSCVAIKVLRSGYLAKEEGDTVRKRILREITVWSRLNHPNIVPFRGLCFDEREYGLLPALISPWYKNGDAHTYLKTLMREEKAVQLDLKLKILIDIAKGLLYLHKRDICHGDLKGPNVLIDDEANARLADFGLARINGFSGNFSFTTQSCNGSSRWMAVELTKARSQGIDCRITKHSDIWSFGRTMFEILTVQMPFYDKKMPEQVLCAVINNEEPQVPPGIVIHPELMVIIRKCWELDPQHRPEIDDLVVNLEALSNSISGNP